MDTFKKLSSSGMELDPPGSVTIYYSSVVGDTDYVTGSLGSYIFTVPKGYRTVSICMIGGGGSGGSVAYNPDGVSGGGYAGTVVTQDVLVIPDTPVTVTIGAGGLGPYSNDEGRVKQGLPGSATIFDTISAAGGAGGVASDVNTINPLNYPGVGAVGATNCFGTFNDGTSVDDTVAFAYGGQAGFANGANGVIYTGGGGGVGLDASSGAGGGGIVGTGASGDTAGDGGNGVCIISWG